MIGILTVLAWIWGVLMALLFALAVAGRREAPDASLKVVVFSLLAGAPAWGWLAARYLL